MSASGIQFKFLKEKTRGYLLYFCEFLTFFKKHATLPIGITETLVYTHFNGTGCAMLKRYQGRTDFLYQHCDFDHCHINRYRRIRQETNAGKRYVSL